MGSSSRTVSLRLLRLLALMMVLLSLFASFDMARMANGSGIILDRFSSDWMLRLGIFGLFAGFSFVIGLLGIWKPSVLLQQGWSTLDHLVTRLGKLRWLLAILFMILPTIIILELSVDSLLSIWIRLIIVLWASIAAAVCLPGSRDTVEQRLALAFLVTAAIYTVSRRFILVTDYPFKLAWSEGNRIWDYSLYFARERYTFSGVYEDPGYLAPGRHGLWGLPFLWSGAQIWLLRLWDAILWTVPYFLLGLALFSKRRAFLHPIARLGLVLWGFLFLSQTGVLAPLILSALLLAVGFRRNNLLTTSIVTAAACFFAGMSRWTWFAAPAVWAAVWMLLEEPRDEVWWRRLMKPMWIGVIGVSAGVLSQLILRGPVTADAPVYATALSQPLLWYRLLPTTTYKMGVLPALILGVGPIIGLLVWSLKRKILEWDLLQLLGITAALGVFFAVGITASVKMGGGNNLHNLDMFLLQITFLLAIGVMTASRDRRLRYVSGSEGGKTWIALNIFVVVLAAFQVGWRIKIPSDEQTQSTLEEVQSRVRNAAQHGEVLFVDHRQLFTFGYLDGIPLTLEYELKELSNRAMSADEKYFAAFEDDLSSGRFSLIISEAESLVYQGRAREFGEENDAWVMYVSTPILKYYDPVFVSGETRISIFEPKDSGGK